MSNDEMLQGYRDGRNPDNPEPSANRSHSYRHGFANGRDDLRRKPRASAAELRVMAADAEAMDAAIAKAESETRTAALDALIQTDGDLL